MIIVRTPIKRNGSASVNRRQAAETIKQALIQAELTAVIGAFPRSADGVPSCRPGVHRIQR
jgi:hypothetical protein